MDKSTDFATVLITHQEVIGWMSYWAVRQHPYGKPEKLFEVNDLITEAAQKWPDGIDKLRMWTVTGWQELEKWLRALLYEHPIMQEWNTPRSKHDHPIVFSSRYDSPKAEHDFIDIDALLRNVALHAWRAAVADQEFDKVSDEAVERAINDDIGDTVNQLTAESAITTAPETPLIGKATDHIICAVCGGMENLKPAKLCVTHENGSFMLRDAHTCSNCRDPKQVKSPWTL